MVRLNLKVWLLLLGWLWLQPALAQHPLAADLPDHSHSCHLCALHLDGKLALLPSAPALLPQWVPSPLTLDALPALRPVQPGQCSIRGPPCHRYSPC